jgi:hypothetical protein
VPLENAVKRIRARRQDLASERLRRATMAACDVD